MGEEVRSTFQKNEKSDFLNGYSTNVANDHVNVIRSLVKTESSQKIPFLGFVIAGRWNHQSNRSYK